MRVILCEKPDQGKAVAKTLGITQSKKGYIEGNGIVVTWCIGHILELAMPDSYDEKYKNWSIEHLPIIPNHWKYNVSSRTASQFKVVKQLLQKASEVIIGTDADREGELIAREVMVFCSYKGPVKRLWYSALNTTAIKKAWNDIQEGEKTYPLYLSALARSKADWLVGLNLSRLFTLLAQQSGYKNKLPVGRVQTPTLKLVVDRELAHKNFVPIPYWLLGIQLSSNGQAFNASWDVPKQFADEAGRCIRQEAAMQATKLFQTIGQATVTSINTERKTSNHPLPFDLAALQLACCNKFGFGVDETLEIAQSLYEKYKATSYPRTECGYLPTSMLGEVPTVFNALAKTDPSISNLLTKLNTNMKSKSWNDKQVEKSSHHGIIPTDEVLDLSTMSEKELQVYKLIRSYYLAQFLPLHEYDHTEVILNCKGQTLVAVGKKIVVNGWKALLSGDSLDDNESEEDTEQSENKGQTQILPPLQEGLVCKINTVDCQSKKTTAPPLYNEGTLVMAMKSVAKLIDDPKIKQKLRETTGIGTQATRSNIIKKLKDQKLITKQKGKLIATEAGHSLIKAVPAAISHPGTTGIWEQALDMIEKGELTIDSFIQKQSQWISTIVQKYGNTELSIKQAPIPTGDPCPKCGKPTLKHKGKTVSFWGCPDYPNCDGVIFPKTRKKNKNFSNPKK
ncbi:DNA topoisomerase III [Entomomonas sp. E2T0]|uniref:DNA topoisomerase III n=1 Tax=Entomomonas sp. E2T0 TaxID=2930213 RepID=UPI0022284778|nr:DNA topoisomerase III [Entomomonas sp. E2T0]UYZ83099.1 DNA topoisomerase III [Entomomonas sp. E2T0]